MQFKKKLNDIKKNIHSFFISYDKSFESDFKTKITAGCR